MSAVTLPRSHDENKGRGRMAGKGGIRNRSSQLENPPVVLPGKTVDSINAPLVTPRKPLSVIDRNSRVPLTTPSQKGGGKKSGRRHAPGSSAVKPKQSSSKEKRKVGAEVARSAAKNAAPTEAEEFPDIETMSRKQEPDGLDSSRVFVPPAYFETLASALKRPVVPPIGAVSYTSALSSLKLEPETELRPTSHKTVSPVLRDKVYRDELNLSVDLPDIDLW